MGQNALFPGSVFNFFSPNFVIPGTSLYGPEFQILTTATTLNRANFVNTFVFGSLGSTTTVNFGSLRIAGFESRRAARFAQYLDAARHDDRGHEEQHSDRDASGAGRNEPGSAAGADRNLFDWHFIAISGAALIGSREAPSGAGKVNENARKRQIQPQRFRAHQLLHGSVIRHDSRHWALESDPCARRACRHRLSRTGLRFSFRRQRQQQHDHPQRQRRLRELRQHSLESRRCRRTRCSRSSRKRATSPTACIRSSQACKVYSAAASSPSWQTSARSRNPPRARNTSTAAPRYQ